jgi:hypothetical protein
MAIQIPTHLQSKSTTANGYDEWQANSKSVAAQVQSILVPYQPISLDEMESVALLNRTDTKFVLSLDQLTTALQKLSDQYRVLAISHRRLHAYHNLYFDTPNFELFNQHHRGQRDRFKVRCRKYVDSDLNFFEIKRKNNCNRTIKSRLKTADFIEVLDGTPNDFLSQHYPLSPQALSPVLWNDFHRITLVSNLAVERLTIDINLGFSDGWNQIGLPGVAVAEVKQDGFSIHSDFMAQMRAFAITPQRFSKYCLGISIFYPRVKANNFKPRTLLVKRIVRQGV